MKVQERVLIVDDDLTVCRVLALILRREGHLVVGQANSGDAALRLVDSCGASLILLDLDMPQLEGLSVLRQLRQCSPWTPVLVLSMLNPAIYALRCMRLGARGYLYKGEDIALLPGAIQQLRNGLMLFPRHVASADMPLANLSDREVITLRGLARGGEEQVMAALMLSRSSVSSMLARLQVKLGLPAVELVEFARSLKLG